MELTTSVKKVGNDLTFFIKEAEVYNFDDDTICSCLLKYEEANQKLFYDTHIVLNWSRVNIVLIQENFR